MLCNTRGLDARAVLESPIPLGLDGRHVFRDSGIDALLVDGFDARSFALPAPRHLPHADDVTGPGEKQRPGDPAHNDHGRTLRPATAVVGGNGASRATGRQDSLTA